MFSLNFFLTAHNASLLTPPGYIELVIDSQSVYATDDDDYHTIFQAVDRHFCLRFKFLTKTPMPARHRHIFGDLVDKEGTVANLFNNIYKKIENHVLNNHSNPTALSLDFDTYKHQGGHISKTKVEPYSGLVFQDDDSARIYYRSHRGVSFLREATLEGTRILLQPATAETIQNIIDHIDELLYTNRHAFRIYDNLLAVEQKTDMSGYANYSLSQKIMSAVEVVLPVWGDHPDTQEYKNLLDSGLTNERLGTILSQLIWASLPQKDIMEKHVKAVLDTLENQENNICEEHLRLGPRGAVLYLLDNRDRFVKTGRMLAKKENF